MINGPGGITAPNHRIMPYLKINNAVVVIANLFIPFNADAVAIKKNENGGRAREEENVAS